MTPIQWLIVSGIAIVVGWIILQPQRWGKRDSGDGNDGSTPVGLHPDRHDGEDSDGDGGGDGGGGD